MASPGRLHGSVNCFQLITVFLLTFINSAFLPLLQPLHPSSSQGPKGFPVAMQDTPGGHPRGFSLQRRIPQVGDTAPMSPTSCPYPQHKGSSTQQPHLPSHSRTGPKAAAAALAPSHIGPPPWHQPHTHSLAHISRSAGSQHPGEGTQHLLCPRELAHSDGSRC